MRRKREALLHVVVSLALTSCVGPSASTPGAAQPVVQFPSRAALERFSSKVAPQQDVARSAHVDHWTLEPEPAAVPETGWERLLVQAAQERNASLVLSPSLRCVAREVTRFQLEHAALPDERLRQFIGAACGSSSAEILIATSAGQAPDEVTEEQLLVRQGPELGRQFGTRLLREPQHAGIWFGRRNGRLLVSLVTSPRHADVTPAAPTPDANGKVLLRGVVRVPAAHVIGLINQGEHGVAYCERDLRLAAPKFALSCPMLAADQTAWIEVLALEKGRVLAKSVGLSLARRDTATTPSYSGTSSPLPAPTDAEAFRALIVREVNAARASAKLRPLALAARQSRSSDRLVSHFVGAAQTGDASTADQIALGLLAGWDVQGTIRTGWFFSSFLTSAPDGRRWLDFVLSRPSGRVALLDKEARQIAIGPELGASAFGALLTTYAFHESADHRSDAVRVLEALNAQRIALGLPKLTWVNGVKKLAEEARRIHAGQSAPAQAVSNAVNAIALESGRSVRGFSIETVDLGLLRFPDELLEPRPLQVALEVTHFRPKGAAWGQYVLLVLILDG
jgi:hypothetical protein